MIPLRLLLVVAVSLWLSGWLVLAGIAAPVLFRSLSSRTQAASIFGEMARWWGVAETALSLIVLSSAGLLFFGGARGGAVRAALAVVLAAVWIAHRLVLWPKAARLHAEVGTFDRDPETEEGRRLRARFSRLHRVSRGLLALQLLLGTALLAWEAAAGVE